MRHQKARTSLHAKKDFVVAIRKGIERIAQYFTPFEVCRLMARLTVGDHDAMREQIARDGVIRFMEPAVGSGAMFLAVAEAMRDAGINYQQHLYVTAVDVDERAAHMAYVHASLLHIPATIVVGNSLSLEVRDVWHTPAYLMGNGQPTSIQRVQETTVL